MKRTQARAKDRPRQPEKKADRKLAKGDPKSRPNTSTHKGAPAPERTGPYDHPNRRPA